MAYAFISYPKNTITDLFQNVLKIFTHTQINIGTHVTLPIRPEIHNPWEPSGLY